MPVPKKLKNIFQKTCLKMRTNLSESPQGISKTGILKNGEYSKKSNQIKVHLTIDFPRLGQEYFLDIWI